MFKHEGLILSEKIESEFNLARRDLFLALKDLVRQAMDEIHVFDTIVSRIEIKDGRIRAFPEERTNKCPEFVEVLMPPQLVGTLRDWAAGPERPTPPDPDPVTLLKPEEAEVWGAILKLFEKASPNSVMYLNVENFSVVRKAGFRRFNITCQADILRKGHMGTLHALNDESKGVHVRVNRAIPRGFAYCVQEPDVQLEPPPDGTYARGNKVNLNRDHLHIIGPVV